MIEYQSTLIPCKATYNLTLSVPAD